MTSFDGSALMNPAMRTEVAGAEKTAVPTTICAAIYVRASTEDQVNGQFTTLAAQEAYCRDYIKIRAAQGWQVYPEVFSDEKSGGTMDRPGLRRLMAAVEAGNVQALVAKASDRLSRDMLDGLMLRKFLADHGAKFYGVMDPADSETPAGEFMQNVIMGMAQWERKTIAKRTKDKLSAMRKNGLWTGSPVILGYDLMDKALVVNEPEAALVRLIFERYLQDPSLRRLAEYLNAQGHRTKRYEARSGKGVRKGGKLFSRPILHYLLTNVHYTGRLKLEAGELVPAKHPPIIEIGLFDRVQARLTANSGHSHSVRVGLNRHAFLLKGLVRCAVCGSTMTPSPGKGRSGAMYRYYRCTSANNQGTAACSVRAVAAEPLEGNVVARLKLLSTNAELVNRIVGEAQAASVTELPVLAGRRDQLEGDLRRVTENATGLVQALARLGRDGGELGLVVRELKALEAEKADLEGSLAKVRIEIDRLRGRVVDAEVLRANLAEITTVYDQLEPTERQELFRLLVAQVEYDGRDRTVRLTLRQLPAMAPLLETGSQELDTNRFDHCHKRLPVSDTGKNGPFDSLARLGRSGGLSKRSESKARGLLWRLVPEDYPDAFPDRFQVETAHRLADVKHDPGLPAEASAQAGGRLEPFPHDLRPAELYALVGRTA